MPIAVVYPLLTFLARCFANSVAKLPLTPSAYVSCVMSHRLLGLTALLVRIPEQAKRCNSFNGEEEWRRDVVMLRHTIKALGCVSSTYSSGAAPRHPDAVGGDLGGVAPAGRAEGDDSGGLGLDRGLHIGHHGGEVGGHVARLVRVGGEVEEPLVWGPVNNNLLTHKCEKCLTCAVIIRRLRDGAVGGVPVVIVSGAAPDELPGPVAKGRCVRPVVLLHYVVEHARA